MDTCTKDRGSDVPYDLRIETINGALSVSIGLCKRD